MKKPTLHDKSANVWTLTVVALLLMMCWMSWTCASSQAQTVPLFQAFQEGPGNFSIPGQVNLTPEPLPTPKFQIKSCVSDWSRRWLCAGDRAPVHGHLVPSKVLIKCAAHKKKAALASYYRGLAQSSQRREQITAGKLALSDDKLDHQLLINTDLSKALDGSFSWPDLFKWSGGALVFGVVTGLLLGGAL